jgi:hypothetical protein
VVEQAGPDLFFPAHPHIVAHNDNVAQ